MWSILQFVFADKCWTVCKQFEQLSWATKAETQNKLKTTYAIISTLWKSDLYCFQSPVILCLLPSALSRVLITQAPSVDGEWGWVAGLQEENQDLGVICPAPQSPVVEEGEGEGGKVEC